MGHFDSHRGVTYLKEYTPLPQDLLPGKKYLARIYTEDITQFLRSKGYVGEVDLIGHFIDPIGNTYSSEPYKFDIDKANDGKG